MMKQNLLMTVAMMGLLGTAYGAGDDVLHGGAALPVPAGAAAHVALAGDPEIQPLIEGMPADGRLSDFVETVNRLIAGKRGYDRLCVIEALAAVPPADRKDVSARSAPLFDEEMRGGFLTTVIETIAGIPGDQRGAFVDAVNRLIAEKHGYDRLRVIETLAAVPAADREAVSKKSAPLIVAGVILDYNQWVIRLIARIASEDLGAFVEAVNPLIAGVDGLDRQFVIEALAAVPPADRDDVSKKLAALFAASRMDGCNRAGVIAGVSRLPAGDRGAFVEVVTHLIEGIPLFPVIRGFPVDPLSFCERSAPSYIISNLLDVPAADRADVSKKSEELFSEGMSAYGRAGVITAVSRLPAEERPAFVKAVNPLIAGTDEIDRLYVIKTLAAYPAADRTDEIGRLYVIKALEAAPAADRADVSKKSEELFSEGMSADGRAEVIQTVIGIPAEERAAFVKAVNPLIAGTGEIDRLHVIKALAAFPAADRTQVIRMVVEMPRSQRIDFVNTINRLIAGTDEIGRSSVIQALATVPTANRGEVSARSAALVSEGMNEVQRARLIRSVAKIPVDQWEAFMENVNFLTVGIDEIGRSYVIDALATVPPADRGEVSARSAALFCEGMLGRYREIIIRSVAKIPVDQWEAFMENVNFLTVGTDEIVRAWVIDFLADVPLADREDVSVKSKALFGEAMDGLGRATMILVFSEISKEDRGAFVEAVTPLIEGIEGDDRRDVIEAFTRVPSAHWGPVALQAAAKIVHGMDREERKSLIQSIAQAHAAAH